MNEDLLSQLRDIHLPEPVSAWPPAWGWWLVSVALLLLVAALTVWLYRRFQRGRLLRQILRQLDLTEKQYQQSRDTRLYLQSVNTLLKVVATRQHADEGIAVLSGDDWLSFLNRTGQTQAFTQAPCYFLGDASYRPVTEDDLDSLASHCRLWLRRQWS